MGTDAGGVSEVTGVADVDLDRLPPEEARRRAQVLAEHREHELRTAERDGGYRRGRLVDHDPELARLREEAGGAPRPPA